MADAPRIDPITLEVLKNVLTATAEETAAVLRRTAYSLNVRERADFSSCVCAADGRIVAQAARIPIHLNSIGPLLKSTLKRFPRDRIEPGDIFISNDPYSGGQHLPDVQLSMPVFHDGELVAFTAALAHHVDIGGVAAGGLANSGREIFHEGLRIPPIKLYQAGEPIAPVMDMIRANVRTPDVVLGDLRAQVAAVQLGARRFEHLVRRYGRDTLLAGIEQLIDYSERRIRRNLAALPDGRYAAEEWIDDDGVTDEPACVRVSVEISGSDVTADFTGTDRQRPGSVNAVAAATRSAVYYAVRALCDADIMMNEGCYEPVRTVLPAGSLVNPLPPAACNSRMIVCQRVVDAIFRALREVAPGRVVTPSYGCAPNLGLTGRHPDTGRYFVFFDGNHASWGARHNKDGIDGCTSGPSNSANSPIEAIEVRHPVLFERYEFVTDSGGAGRFRGGLAIARDFRSAADEALLTVQCDRARFPPGGYFGGLPGEPAEFALNAGTAAERALHSKATSHALAAGDRFHWAAAGGGGFGDPLTRDPELVRRDVRDEKVSTAAARDRYGVVIDPASGTVDKKATTRLREEAAGNRSRHGTADTGEEAGERAGPETPSARQEAVGGRSGRRAPVSQRKSRKEAGGKAGAPSEAVCSGPPPRTAEGGA
ncbi:MAG: hydantoinase B/oxoprolinase family protein [Spirochaetaceae bacterium]|nr:hydantoinase B/oxoprolinase family protein [Spirochaetaceae bacterium]